MRPFLPFFKKTAKPFAVLACVLLVLFGAYALLPVFGEPPRLEQEYKLSLSDVLADDEKRQLYDLVASELPKMEWANAKFVSGSYYMGSGLDASYFEDTYYDDASGTLSIAGISHRLRYRWNAPEDVEEYERKGILPQRFELQTKVYGTGAIADSAGYKKALKNRYEIKKDFRLNPVTEFILDRKNGDGFISLMGNRLFWNRFSPVTLVLDAVREKGISDFRYSDLKPAVRMVVKRTRFHVNKKTPFGYGDNPDNVFLVTIDDAKIYAPNSSAEVIGEFSEIEIDFERNTFFKLFDSVYKAGNQTDVATLASFEEDQKSLKELIAKELTVLGHPPETGKEVLSKFSKALRLEKKPR